MHRTSKHHPFPRLSTSQVGSHIPSAPSTSRRGTMAGAIALTTIGHGLADIGSSYCKGVELADARHHDRLFRRDRWDGVLAEVRKCAQEQEAYLSDEDLATIFEVFQAEEANAKACLAIKSEGVRKVWVRHQISRMAPTA